MCILSYFRPESEVNEEHLLNGGLSNPDGHGWAITAGDRIIIGKSLDLNEALDGFVAARKAHPGQYGLFHSRWATHGRVTTDNVHPFVTGHSEQTVVAHNGILPGSAHPGKGDERSDTRKFADEILSTRYRRLNRERVRNALADWIGTGNKLVILTVDPRYRNHAYLINGAMGTWEAQTGVWHSNYDYEDKPWWMRQKGRYVGYSTGYGYGGSYPVVTIGRRNDDSAAAIVDRAIAARDGWQADNYEHCVYCDEHVGAGGYCTVCGTCQDCLEAHSDCLCYDTGSFVKQGAWEAFDRGEWEYEDDGTATYRYVPDH